MPYGSSHTSTLPTVSVTTGPTYATQINAAITEIRATVDAKVTPAGITINADLPFTNSGVFYACTSVERTNYQNKSGTISAGTFPVSVYVANGNLHYNDGAGNIIQLTSGGALNIAATGGITGAGYGSAGVEVNWESGTTRYRFKSASGADAFAHVAVNDLLLNDGSGNFITFAAPAISADYTVTWPTAVPAATELVSMSSAGTLTAAGSHGNRLLLLPPPLWIVDDGTGTVLFDRVTMGTADDTYRGVCGIPLKVGDRIRSIVFYTTALSNDWDFELIRINRSTLAVTVVSTTNVTSPGEISLTSIDHTMLEDFSYSVRVAHDADTTVVDLVLSYCEVTYDRP